MGWAWIEALEERALLSSVAPADADPRLRVDVSLNVSVPAGRLIPTEFNPRDVIFDAARDQLIVVEEQTNERFSALDWTRFDTFFSGNYPSNADISPDRKFLYVSHSQTVQKIDLDTLASSYIPIDGIFDMAMSSDGLIVSHAGPNDDFNTINRISPADDSVQEIPLRDDGGTYLDDPAALASSADLNHLAMTSATEDYVMDNGVIRGQEHPFGYILSSAVNRDGSLHAIALFGWIVVENSAFEEVARVPVAGGRVIFDPTRDVLYAADPQNHLLRAYDTNTWQQIDSIPVPDIFYIGDRVGLGQMAISPDGQSLFLTVDHGVRVFDFTKQNSFYGSGVTFTAQVTPIDYYGGVPTGMLSFLDGESILWTGFLTNGAATLTVDDLPAGTHSINAKYLENDVFQSGQSPPTTLTVHPALTSVALDIMGWATARATVNSVTGRLAGGTVSLMEHDQVIATVPLTALSLEIPFDLPPGWHSLTARYDGSANFAPSASAERTVMVPSDSSITLTQSSENSIYTQAVTLTATVSGATPEPAMVTFFDGDKVLQKVWADFGRHAVLTLEGLSAGSHDLHAAFGGSFTLKPSVSSSITHTVQRVTTTTVLTAPSVSDWAHGMLVKAKVSASSGLPVNEGRVNLYVDGVFNDFVEVEGGEAIFDSPGVLGGNHTLSAKYVGNDSIADSTSNAVPVRVLRGLVKLKFEPSRNWTITGESIDWKTSFIVQRQGGGYSEGSFRFSEGRRVFQTVQIDSDPVSITTPPLSAGEHLITATYMPAGDNWTGASTTVKVNVVPATTVDLMMLYTYNAMNDVGSHEDMRDLITDAVDQTNEAMLNSRIPVHLRLVQIAAINYRESGKLETDLKRLAAPKDHSMDEVQQMRKQYGADLVSLLELDGDSGGIAYELHDVREAGNAARGFSVVLYQQAAAPYYSLAHELGHNFGATHDVQHNEGRGATSFSNGYRFRAGGKLYHDIMSYDPGQRIPYFSSPLIKYKGVSIGTANSADAARTIAMTAPYVAAYLKRKAR